VEETILQKALNEQKWSLDVLKINLNKELERKQMDMEVAKIENDIFMNREKT